MWMMGPMNAGSSPQLPCSEAVDRPIDPLLAGRPPSRRGDPPRRPRHPARGARAVALLASAASTAGLAAWIAYGEGAFEAAATPESDAGPNVPGVSPGLIPSSTTVADESPAAGSVGDEVASATPASTVAPATTIVPEINELPTVDPLADELASDDVFTTSVTSGFADGVFVGAAEYTEWGNVQVEVRLVDGRIVDIEAIAIPSGRRSTQINDRAEPILEADAIALQASDLDIVSGATYTSITYADSLQAALDAAALAAEPVGVAGVVGVSA